MKKLLGYILFMIVAVAMFTPCCAVDNCESDQLTSEERSEKRGFGGTCSPFFSCAGCAAITVIPKAMVVPAHHQSEITHVTSLAEYPLFAFKEAPWQPPRSVVMV